MDMDTDMREIRMVGRLQDLPPKVQKAMEGVKFFELGTSKRSQELMEQYYKIYCQGFQDPEECESKETMLENMKLSAAGEIKGGSFHVFVAIKEVEDEHGNKVLKVVAGRNVSYLIEPNTLISEFRATDPVHRGNGIGWQLVKASTEAIDLVAQSHGHQHLDFSLIEQNDPARYHTTSGAETPEVNQKRLDNARRDGWEKAHCKYDQPELESTGKPVKGLNLLVREENPAARREREEISDPAKRAPLKPMKKETLLGIIEGYFRNGMGYSEPKKQCPEYIKLKNSIEGPTVKTVPLYVYAEWTRAILNAPMYVAAAKQAMQEEWERKTGGRHMGDTDAQVAARTYFIEKRIAHEVGVGDPTMSIEAFASQQVADKYPGLLGSPSRRQLGMSAQEQEPRRRVQSLTEPTRPRLGGAELGNTRHRSRSRSR